MTDWRILILVGRPRASSQKLLLGYLQEETGLPVEVREITDVSVLAAKKQTLLLCDCQGLDAEAVALTVDRLGVPLEAGRAASGRLVLYNLAEEIELEDDSLAASSLWGVVYDNEGPEILLRCLGAVRAGEIWLPRHLLSRCLESLRQTESLPGVAAELLSLREREVLELIGTGAGNEEIAERLGISPHTVRSHIYRIFRKIEVPNRQRAALWAARNLGDA